MEVLYPQRPREFHRMGGAADVHRHVKLRRGGHVVHGGQVKEVLDRPLELGDLLVLESEQELTQISDHRVDAPAHRCLASRFPPLDRLVQASERVLAHEHVDLALALEQPLDESAADEARCSRYEIRHAISSRSISRG